MAEENFGFTFTTSGAFPSISMSSPTQTVSGGTNWAFTAVEAGDGTDYRQISAGRSYTTAIKSDGTLWSWGVNTNGQLGISNTIDSYSPTPHISGTADWEQVSAGHCTTAAIKTDGSLWLWGGNGNKQLGNNSMPPAVSSPVQTISVGTNWKQVSVGRDNVSAVKTDGTLWSWGNGSLGQLGNNNISAFNASPVQTISGGTNWKQVSAGVTHSAAVKTDGTLWLWGSGDFGELGNNSIVMRSSPVQTISSGTNWKQVSASYIGTNAIKTDGSLWSWGAVQVAGNSLGVSYISSPVQTVSAGTNWKQVTSGYLSAAAIKTDGTLWLWGDNAAGIIGNNVSVGTLLSPAQTITGGTDWATVSSSHASDIPHVVAVKTDGSLWTWGCNSFAPFWQHKMEVADVYVKRDYFSEGGLWGMGPGSALGIGSGADISSPVQTVSGGTNWKQVSGGHYLGAAIKTDGSLWLWSNSGGSAGHLGNNSILPVTSPVQTISGGTNWKQVSANHWGTVSAIKTDGSLWLWGCNLGGNLGNSSILNASSPVQTISGGTNWKQVSAGHNHTAAIKTDGSLWTWGCDSGQQLGRPGPNASSPVQTVSGGTNWKQVAAGYCFTTAIKTDGSLWLWGDNNAGEMGRNDIIAGTYSPSQTISGGNNWKQVSASAHVAAIKTDGSLWLWGQAACGSLGNNSIVYASSPVQTISSGTNWKQVATGRLHTSAIKNDGSLWGWGDGQFGTMGNNTSLSVSSPVQTISGGTNWKQVAAGSYTTFAITYDVDF